MLAKVHSCAVVGLDAEPIDIEVDIASGLERITLVGLPDAAVRESGKAYAPPSPTATLSPTSPHYQPSPTYAKRDPPMICPLPLGFWLRPPANCWPTSMTP